MESLYLLIPISLIILAAAIAIFFWAVNSGQYDDVDREGDRILYDDDDPDDEGASETAKESRSGESNSD